MMNFNILELAMISVIWSRILSRLLLILVSKRRALVDLVLLCVWRMMVWLEMALANKNRNWPASDLLRDNRSVSSMKSCGMYSVVVITISLWMAERALLKMGAGFLFLFLVTCLNAVSSLLAASPAYVVIPVGLVMVWEWVLMEAD